MSPSHQATISYYDQIAETYANSACKRDMTSAMSPFLEILQPHGLLLDLGSGAGRDSLKFEELGHSVVSIDRSFGLLKEHKMRGGDWLLSADMEFLPFPENRFHGVWACASLLHIPKVKIQKVLAEVKRVLLPGGIFFSAMKSGTGEGTKLSEVGVPCIADQPSAQNSGRYWSFYQKDEWLENLENAGFSTIWSSMTADQAGRDLRWLNVLVISK